MPTRTPSPPRRRGARVAGHVAHLGVATLVLAGAAACGGTAAPTIDGTRIEQKIRSEADGGAGRVEKVSCPQGREAKGGESFQCTATVAGGVTLTYDVVVSSEKGDYTYRLAPNQTLDGEGVAREVAADIAATGPDFATAAVVCPKQLLAPSGTATADCALTLGDHTATLVVSKAPGQAARWAFKK